MVSIDNDSFNLVFNMGKVVVINYEFPKTVKQLAITSR